MYKGKVSQALQELNIEVSSEPDTSRQAQNYVRGEKHLLKKNVASLCGHKGAPYTTCIYRKKEYFKSKGFFFFHK